VQIGSFARRLDVKAEIWLEPTMPTMGLSENGAAATLSNYLLARVHSNTFIG
jgi:hypothetical protein